MGGEELFEVLLLLIKVVTSLYTNGMANWENPLKDCNLFGAIFFGYFYVIYKIWIPDQARKDEKCGARPGYIKLDCFTTSLWLTLRAHFVRPNLFPTNWSEQLRCNFRSEQVRSGARREKSRTHRNPFAKSVFRQAQSHPVSIGVGNRYTEPLVEYENYAIRLTIMAIRLTIIFNKVANYN